MNCELCRELRKKQLIEEMHVAFTNKNHLEVVQELANELNSIYYSIETMMDELYRTKKETRIVTKQMKKFVKKAWEFVEAYYEQDDDGEFYIPRFEYCAAVHAINIMLELSKVKAYEELEDEEYDDDN